MVKVIIVILLAFSVMAGAQDYLSDGKSFGEAVKNNGGASTTDNALNFEGTDVAGKEFFGAKSLSGMETSARIEATTSETGKYIEESSANRPTVVFDTLNDPLFKRFDEVLEKANSLTDSYSGCVELPVGDADVTDITLDSCLKTGTHNVINYTCSRSLIPSCSNAKAGLYFPTTASFFTISGDSGVSASLTSKDNFRFGPSGNDSNNRTGTCKWYHNNIRFYVVNKEQVQSIRISGGRYDDWMYLYFNNSTIFRGIGNILNNNIVKDEYNCERGIYNLSAGSVKNMKPYVRNGWNTIRISNLVSGSGMARINLEVKILEPCGQKTNTSISCPNGSNTGEGTYISSSCTEGAKTKYVGVFPFYKSCWKWDLLYKKNSSPIYTTEQKCETLRTNGCTTDTSSCLEYHPSLGYCKKRKYDFKCYDTHSSETVTMCADTLICEGGDCGAEYQQYDDATDDFKKAVATFDMANSIGSSFGDDLTIFKGSNFKCTKDEKWGTKDCCKDSGWAVGSFANCSGDEKTLGLAKEDGRAFQTRKWTTSKSNLGVETEKWSFRAYCVFPSKLARIIMEQGYKQINHTVYGNKSPDCRGLTAEEIGRIDFDKIDLGEFYEDVMDAKDGATVPAIDAMRKRLEAQLKTAEGK